ncbi:hypothetical protein J6590_064783 [Homalodisca vitripennis]|nr:hypothetical protein J6590_064783 [Homalodisca vitripennis]
MPVTDRCNSGSDTSEPVIDHCNVSGEACCLIHTKIAIVKNLQHPPKPNALKRLESKPFHHESPIKAYVTRRTTELFDILLKKGK